MIRFVLSPDGIVTPDVKRKLPGRGVWITATRACVAGAVKKRAFARALRADVSVPQGLAGDVEALLARAALERLSIANKAGLVTAGFEKVRAALHKGYVAGILVAADAAADGAAKVEALAKHVGHRHNVMHRVDAFSSAELGGALGRDRVVHVALAPDRLSELFFTDAERLSAYRHGVDRTATHTDQPDEPRFAGPLTV